MSCALRRSLRLRSSNLPEDEKEEPAVKVKAASKRRTVAITAEKDKSPLKKKSKENEEKEVKNEEIHEEEKEEGTKEEEDTSDEEKEKDKVANTSNRFNGRIVKNNKKEKKRDNAVATIEPVKRSQRRCSLAAAEAVKKIVSTHDDPSDDDEDYNIEKEMEIDKDKKMRMKKEKDKISSSISTDEKKNVKTQVKKVMINRKGTVMKYDSDSEDEEDKERDKPNKKKEMSTAGSISSKVSTLQRPPSLDRPYEKVRLLMDRKYEVDRDEMISWEKRAVLLAREMRELESENMNNTGRMKEVMNKVNEFVVRCLKNRACEMGEQESVRQCHVLQAEFDEWERKKKMTITQRIKETVENEKKEREAEESDEDEEEEDEWEDMETVDGDGEVKTVQVHVENKDMSTHWKSKWLKQEVNRTMRTRCENTHKAHLLSYISHLRHLAAMALSSTSKKGEIPLAAIALSMITHNLKNIKKKKKKNSSKDIKNLIEWWWNEFKKRDKEEDDEEGKSEEERISERMINRRFNNHKEAAIIFFSLASSAGFTVRIVCRCEVMTKKVPESPESKKKDEKKKEELKKKSKNKPEESLKKSMVDYWIEMWEEENNSWKPISVIRPDPSINQDNEDEDDDEGHISLYMESLNSNMEKGGQVLYMLAIDNEFAIRDVSARYIHSQDFVSKEFRKRRAGQEWLNELWDMEPWRAHLIRSCKEDDEWMTSMKAELPKFVGQYKDHPLYVLDKDVLKMQRIFPYNVKPLGEIRGYKIYSRKYVRPTNTAKRYERLGRQVRADEPPVGEKKLTNPFTGESMMQGLFGYWQTDPWDAGEVENGIVPRNEFDNIYMYQPKEMCPKGGIYIIPEGLQRVALELGKDFVQAVVGWIYKNGNIIPLIRGAVFAKEDIPELIGAWKECQRRWKEEERKIRSERAVNGWKKLIKGMLRLAAMRKEFEPMENRKKKGTRMEDEAVRAEEEASWPQQRYGADLFE